MGKKQMNNKKEKKGKKKKIWKKVVLLILIVLLISGGWFAYKVHINGGGLKGMLATVAGHDENTKKNLSEFRCLLLGISTDQDGVLLTDTILVASYNPNTQRATLLSIPRDTYTGNNPAKASAYEKINALYSRKQDPKEVLDAINNLTGLNLEYYAIVKTEAFIKLVDAIGGVTFNVPIDMNYDDPSQDLHIHLKAGEQLLDGDKAEQVVRFRHNNNGTSYPDDYGNNDIGRMRTQREFIIQVIKQTAKAENIFKISQILDIAKENLVTNVDYNAIKDYIPYAVEFDTANMLTEVLPGSTPSWEKTNNVSVFIADKVATKELVQELFYDRDIVETDEEGKEDNNTTSSNKTTSKSSIAIEVLNGSGDSKKLQNVIKELEGAGYKISKTGSTTTTARTTIVNKKDVKESILNNIKQTVGIGVVSTSTGSDTDSSKIDVTIIIGKDY